MAEQSPVAHADVLAVFDPGVPLTAPEIAAATGCARRTAHKKLVELADRGELETKKVGARGRVWWQPSQHRDRPDPRDGSEPSVGNDPPSGWDAHARALRELHDASRELMRAEGRVRICEIAVTAAKNVLGLSLSGLWLYDPEREVLDPVAWTESGVEEYGEPPAFPIGDSLVGRTFRDGEYRLYDDVTTEEDLYDPETRVRSELILPLGGHGVVNASSPAVGVFDEVDVSLGRILAANVQAALDRADRLEQRRARRRELKRQRDELERLNRINELVEETIGALVGAATRAEIEETVCERLGGSQRYVDVWIVERDASGVALRVAADGGDGTVGSPTDPGGYLPDPGPIEAAIENRSVEVIPRISDDEHAAGRTDAGTDAGTGTGDARACLVVPLAGSDTVFGAVVVHAAEPDGFGDREVAAFGTLGRVVGFAITATNNRQLLLGTTAIEIEVAVRDADAWFLSAAHELDGTVSVDGLVPTGEGTFIEYVTVEGAGETTPDAVEDLSVVEGVRVLAAEDDRLFLECTVREADAGLRGIVEYGATVRAARADGERGRVTARFPTNTSAREAVGVLRNAFPGAELVAKRVVDLSDQSATTIRETVVDRLTDRQLTALRAAFLAGYYDSPRGTTGRELADSLDVAPSTFHQHLQAASRKLLATVFGDPPD